MVYHMGGTLMKKSAIILSILSVSLFSVVAFAEEQMDPGKMKGKGMMHQQPVMVATSDGGVVVLQVPKLVKYDAMLTLVNSVELPKGGPSPDQDKKNWKEVPQNDAGAQPMNDEQIAAMLAEDHPAEAPSEAPSAPSEAPPAQEPPPGQ